MYSILQKEIKIKVKDLIEKYQDRDRFIKYCKKCSNYGNRWSCPPINFDTNEYLLKYDWAHIICTKIVLNPDLVDKVTLESEITEITNKSISDVREVLSDNLLLLESKYPNSISIVSGGCNICKNCQRTIGNDCIYPEKMRYSLDTFGFDFTYILEDLFDVELKWGNSKLPEYFTLVSAFLTNHQLLDIINDN